MGTRDDKVGRVSSQVGSGGSARDAVSDARAQETFSMGLGCCDEVISVVDLEKCAEETPIIKLCDSIIMQAIDLNASTIHIESVGKNFFVRMRVDGKLRMNQELPRALRPALLARIKIMAQMDIVERRLPQQGVIRLPFGSGQSATIRVATMPVQLPDAGVENVVMHVTTSQERLRKSDEMGFSKSELDHVKEVLDAGRGLVLVTAPHDHGRHQTLAVMAAQAATTERSAWMLGFGHHVIPDGVHHATLDLDIGLSYESQLRALQKNDADVLVTDELPSYEAAEIAVQEAASGKLVLAGMTEKNAISALYRLNTMGVDWTQIVSSVRIVIAQRLVRTLCKKCRVLTDEGVPWARLKALGASEADADRVADALMYLPVGCHECSQTGYKGRTAVFEVLVLNDALRDLLLKNVPRNEFYQEAVADGMVTLHRAAVCRFLDGTTSLDEVMPVTSSL